MLHTPFSPLTMSCFGANWALIFTSFACGAEMLNVTVLSGFITVDGVCGPIWADAETQIVSEANAGKKNPVRKGAQARRAAAKKVREQRNEYFRQMAIEKSIEKARERQLHEDK